MGLSGKAEIMLVTLLTATLLLGSGVRATADDEGANAPVYSSRFSLGYRVADADGVVGRAAEYTRQKDSVAGSIGINAFSQERHFILEGNYLNDADYNAELHFDDRGLLRVNAYGESLYHNLDHIPYPTQNITNPVTGTPPLTVRDQNPGSVYHMEVQQSSVAVRGKLPNYPAHVNLSYWRLNRVGQKQLRYVDESCGGCHKQSRSRTIDRVTEEFKGSVDAHLGPVDLIFEQLVRLFRNREAIPEDTFEPHTYRTTNPALLQHDEVPDTRLLESTIKAHTSLAGGLNAAASFTYGTRKNQSDLTTVTPVEAETDFTKTVGDVTYIPNPNWTFNLRYRLLDMDTSNNNTQVLNDVLADPNSYTLTSITVRDSINLTRAWYSATGSWRPNRTLTLKGAYRRVDIDRSNTGAPGDATAWDLPAKETQNTYRLSAYIHPATLRGLKINTWYQYRTSDDPAYATTIARGHEGYASLNWTAGGHWGAMVNGRVAWNENNETSQFQENAASTLTDYPIKRRNLDGSVGAGVWMAAGKTLHISLNYGYFRNRIVQDLVFGQDTVNQLTLEDSGVTYQQQVHTATAAANWQIAKPLGALLEGHYSHSRAHYDPEFATVMDYPVSGGMVLPRPVTSDQLRDLSAFDIQQFGILAGLDWKLGRYWTCSGRYSYDDYNDDLSGLFEGSAQTVTVTLARAW